MYVGESRRAGEAWVDVDHRRAAGLRLHHPLEAHRVRLGHVGTLDDDAVRVLQVLLKVRRAAATEAGPQTGNRAAVSYARLVLDLQSAKGGKQLLDEVVLFVVQRRAAEAREAHGPASARPVGLPLPGLGARLDDPVGDLVHRVVERDALPFGAVRAPIEGVLLPGCSGGELQAGRALRAEPAAADRRVGVALDLDDLLVLDVDVLAAADRAVRADRLDHLVGGPDPRAQLVGGGRPDRLAAAERIAVAQLPVDRPLAQPAHDTAAHVPDATQASNEQPPRGQPPSPALRAPRVRRPRAGRR